MTSSSLVATPFLSSAQGEEVKADENAQVVFLIGPLHSGKTTAVASIYSAFFYGPVADLSFVWSRTLLGFENRAYLARTSSGSPSMGAERTSRSETGGYLHLRLQDDGNGQVQRTLLFADWSGEESRDLMNSRDRAAALEGLKACDHLAILLDGQRVKDTMDRQNVLDETIQLLRSCLDSGVLKSGVHASVVLSKWDILKSKAGRTSGAAWVSDTVEPTLEALFSDRFASLTFFRVSARSAPLSSVNTRSAGMGALLRHWFDRPPTISGITG